MATTTFTLTKDPAAVLDYSWDWSLWLGQVNDTIASATVRSADGVVMVDEPVVDDTLVTQRVSGGALGSYCSLVCQITTSGGLVDERTIYLNIEDR